MTTTRQQKGITMSRRQRKKKLGSYLVETSSANESRIVNQRQYPEIIGSYGTVEKRRMRTRTTTEISIHSTGFRYKPLSEPLQKIRRFKIIVTAADQCQHIYFIAVGICIHSRHTLAEMVVLLVCPIAKRS